jgi:F-type H+-transporting ATPase subunit c
MSDAAVMVSALPILAGLNIHVAYAAALMIALPPLAAALSVAHVGSKFLDCCARQPEAMGELTGKFIIIGGLIDGLAVISICMGVVMFFVNPLASSVVALVV